MKMPFFQFYPLDWLRDTAKLSPAAQAAWIKILCYAWNEPERGVYTRPIKAMAYEIQVDLTAITSIINELHLVANVLKDGENVTIVSRRMVKEEVRREYERNKKRKQRGMGTVPEMSLNGPQSVPPKKLEVRSQKLEETTKTLAGPRPHKVFSKPTASEVTAYAESLGYPLDGQQFCDYYESKGWLVGKAPMKDWQAAVRTWKRSHVEKNGQQKSKDFAWMNQ